MRCAYWFLGYSARISAVWYVCAAVCSLWVLVYWLNMVYYERVVQSWTLRGLSLLHRLVLFSLNVVSEVVLLWSLLGYLWVLASWIHGLLWACNAELAHMGLSLLQWLVLFRCDVLSWGVPFGFWKNTRWRILARGVVVIPFTVMEAALAWYAFLGFSCRCAFWCLFCCR